MPFAKWDRDYIQAADGISCNQKNVEELNIKKDVSHDFSNQQLHETLETLSIGKELCQTCSINYQIMRVIGLGSFGRVHLVRHIDSGEYFALKILDKSTIAARTQIEQIKYEGQILASIQHPFIVRIRESFQDDRYLCMVLEYVSGGELFSLLKRFGAFPVHIARFYAAEVLLALAYLHVNGLVYRDLKPENILLDQAGHVKLIDFGFSKRISGTTGTICGTPAYMAPEIFTGNGYSTSVDYYALGILIYEMLAGFPPFPMENKPEVVELIKAGIQHFPQSFDSASILLIRQLCNPNPDARLGSFGRGIVDIFQHEWFSGIDFGALLTNRHIPPYIPFCTHQGDTRNFDVYSDLPNPQQPFAAC